MNLNSKLKLKLELKRKLQNSNMNSYFTFKIKSKILIKHFNVNSKLLNSNWSIAAYKFKIITNIIIQIQT